MAAQPSSVATVGHDGPGRAERLPADGLLHPVALIALGVLLLNDHVLKAAWPGLVTGKLSDLAGLIFFPILLMSAAELALAMRSRWRAPSTRPLTLGIVITAIGFGLAKTVPAAAEASGWLFGLGQWVLSLPIRVLAGSPVPPVAATRVVLDPTDLVALPCLALAFWLGMSRIPKVERPGHRAGAERAP